MLKKMILAAAVALVVGAVGTILAADLPFPGRYQLTGDPAKLLRGEKILVEDFLSPLCPNCYLYHKNAKPLGDDVETKLFYVFAPDHGERTVRLLMIARDQGAEVERKTLAALFAARFEQQVNTEDEDVLDAIAGSLGLGEAWAAKKNAPETDKKMKDMAATVAAREVERTPRVMVQGVVQISPAISNCTGDELPAVVQEVLQNLRQYRKAHGR